MIAAGRLNERVTFQRYVRGDATDTLEHVGTCWAEVRPISGSERWRAGETESELTHLITVRRCFDVRPSDRIVHGSRTYEIRSVRDVESAGALYEIDAAEVV